MDFSCSRHRRRSSAEFVEAACSSGASSWCRPAAPDTPDGRSDCASKIHSVPRLLAVPQVDVFMTKCHVLARTAGGQILLLKPVLSSGRLRWSSRGREEDMDGERGLAGQDSNVAHFPLSICLAVTIFSLSLSVSVSVPVQFFPPSRTGGKNAQKVKQSHLKSKYEQTNSSRGSFAATWMIRLISGVFEGSRDRRPHCRPGNCLDSELRMKGRVKHG